MPAKPSVKGDLVRSLLLSAILVGAASCTLPPPEPGRLTLSNFSFAGARVEAVVTANADCNPRTVGMVARAFVLPLNATRVIAAPPGADVCWRRELAAEPETPNLTPPAVPPGVPAGRPRWSGWNRAYLSLAPTVDAQL